MSPKFIFSALLVTASSVVAAQSVWAEGYVKSYGTPAYSEGCHVIVPGQSYNDACNYDYGVAPIVQEGPMPVIQQQVQQVPEIRIQKVPVVQRVYEQRIEKVPVVKRVEEVHIQKVPVVKRVYEERIEKVPVVKRVEVPIIEKVPVVKRVYEQRIEKVPVVKRVEEVQIQKVPVIKRVEVPVIQKVYVPQVVKVPVKVVQEVPQVVPSGVGVLQQVPQVQQQIVPVRQQAAHVQTQPVPVVQQRPHVQVQPVPVIGQQAVVQRQVVPVVNQQPQVMRQVVPVTQQHVNYVGAPTNIGVTCGNFGCGTAPGYYTRPIPRVIQAPAVVPQVWNGPIVPTRLPMNYNAHGTTRYVSGVAQQVSNAATGTFANIMSASNAVSATQAQLAGAGYGASSGHTTKTTIDIAPVPAELDGDIFAPIGGDSDYIDLTSSAQAINAGQTYVSNGYTTAGEAASSFVQGTNVSGYAWK